MNYSNLVIKLTRSEGRGQRFESSRVRHFYQQNQLTLSFPLIIRPVKLTFSIKDWEVY